MRFIPIIIIFIVVIVAFALGWNNYFTLEALNKEHVFLKGYVAEHPFLATIWFILIYIALTSVALPVDTFLVMLGGYLFPEPYSLIYVTISATIGATFLFLAAKTAFEDLFFRWASPFLKKMEKGFKENAVSYILFLRLIPLFPFWLTNIAPAFFGVPLSTYFWTTFVGVIPFAFVFTQVGAGISAILDTHQDLSLATLLNSNMRIALIGLGVLALLPIVLKSYFPRQQTRL
jgi:uncharacterized membrane protein YdjX (TVP38/TMEM64 family)